LARCRWCDWARLFSGPQYRHDHFCCVAVDIFKSLYGGHDAIDIPAGAQVRHSPWAELWASAWRRSSAQRRQDLFARRRLKVDSAMVPGLQLARRARPVLVRRPAGGVWGLCRRDTQNGAPRQVTARLLGGLLSLDGMLSWRTARSTCRRLWKTPTWPKLPGAGPASAAAEREGLWIGSRGRNAQGKHTWHGDGINPPARGGPISVPAILRCSQLLSVQRPDSTAFTNSNIELFALRRRFGLGAVRLQRRRHQPQGKGRMNGQRQIDLKFYPLVGREERQLRSFGRARPDRQESC